MAKLSSKWLVILVIAAVIVISVCWQRFNEDPSVSAVSTLNISAPDKKPVEGSVPVSKEFLKLWLEYKAKQTALNQQMEKNGIQRQQDELQGLGDRLNNIYRAESQGRQFDEDTRTWKPAPPPPAPPQPPPPPAAPPKPAKK